MAIKSRHNRAHRKNFTAKNRGPKIVVGKVYATWCGHCNELAPEWKKMKQQLKNSVKVVDILETVPSKKCGINLTNLRVDGFPTIFKTKNGGVTFEYYTGPRTATEMANWVRE